MHDKNMLDCRGLSCPEPVVRAKKLIAESHPEKIEVLVDNQAAMENVSRLLKNQGYLPECEKIGPAWSIQASLDNITRTQNGPYNADCVTEKVCVVISSQFFGSGDDELGAKLMRNFLSTLPEFGKSLWLLILLNGGVKLAVKDSYVLAQLQAIEAGGTNIRVCGTCLEHFKLLENKVIGETTNMLDVVTSMQVADKLIKV